jgi:hypothetical protein
MSIRSSTKYDLPDLARMATCFVEKAYGGGIDTDRFIRTVIAFLTSGAGAAFVIEIEGKVVGAAGIVIVPHWFKPINTAEEMFWWIDEEYRGGRDSLLLFDAIEKWAFERTSGEDEMVVSSNEQIHPEKTGRFYLHRGYRKMETKFVRRLHA